MESPTIHGGEDVKHVERLKVAASEFEDILDSLTQIFQAAVETGNPIRWN